MGPPERWQHTGCTLELTEQAGLLAARVLGEHVLDKLLLLRLINPTQQAAGLKLADDYVCAGLQARLGASYSGMRSEGGGVTQFVRNAGQEKAYRRWLGGVKALKGATQDCVISVCCAGLYPAPLKLKLLQDGLQHLARHYGLQR